MEEERLERMIREREGSFSIAFPKLMRKVYVWMTLAMVITGVTAYGVASNPGLISMLVQSRMPILILGIVELGLVFALCARIHKMSLTTATLMFVIYSIINGVTLSFIFLAFTMTSITSVFFVTAGTFAVMSLVGYFIKSDLSGMGRFLYMALFGLIIATFANLLLHIAGLAAIINYAGVLIFAGLTAYDTQKIKQMFIMCDDMTEDMQKLAVIGALTLYLDFINMFLYLLRIFGDSRE